ncbi:MAG TPA: putative metal-dependent hydrolase [Candidatus Dormibacteraeota bacterium]|nr:putative metal-dependent hydrolase [Candidatus Dormibacteraeota bacterium]
MDPRYPIGKFELPKDVTPELRRAAIEDIAATPGRVRAAVAGLNDAQLDTSYREGGWTVRQVVHHLVDSHMNAYIRLRFALTENQPTIKPYDENNWANLEDARSAPVEVSLRLLEPLHERWVRLLRSVKTEQYARTLLHPDHGVKNVDWLLFLYSWHGKHHTAHITELRKQKGW